MIPKIEEQRRVTEVLSAIDETIMHAKADIAEIAELKQKIMEDLISDRIIVRYY